MYLAVDGDSIVYRCAFAAEKSKYLVETWEDNPQLGGVDSVLSHHDDAKAANDRVSTLNGNALIWTRKEVDPVENCLHSIKHTLERIHGAYPSHTLCIWLSPSVGNFRDAIATRAKYKGNRDFIQRPVHYRAAVDYLVRQYGARHTEGQEADDAIGIMVSGNPGSVCVSNDKDLNQLPGLHFNPFPATPEGERYQVSIKQGYVNFLTQCLTGDSVDNVPGIEGVGPVKARNILDGAKDKKEGWSRVLKAFEASYGKEDGPRFALETARLVWVRRKDGELWAPPT